MLARALEVITNNNRKVNKAAEQKIFLCLSLFREDVPNKKQINSGGQSNFGTRGSVSTQPTAMFDWERLKCLLRGRSVCHKTKAISGKWGCGAEHCHVNSKQCVCGPESLHMIMSVCVSFDSWINAGALYFQCNWVTVVSTWCVFHRWLVWGMTVHRVWCPLHCMLFNLC